METSENCSVKVAVHVRPLIGDERLQGCKECVVVTHGKPQVFVFLLFFVFLRSKWFEILLMVCWVLSQMEKKERQWLVWFGCLFKFVAFFFFFYLAYFIEICGSFFSSCYCYWFLLLHGLHLICCSCVSCLFNPASNEGSEIFGFSSIIRVKIQYGHFVFNGIFFSPFFLFVFLLFWVKNF